MYAAEGLLDDPALFSARRLQPGGEFGYLDGVQLLLEYIDICEMHPTPWRMVKGHAFKLLGAPGVPARWACCACCACWAEHGWRG